jgi:hypothetical protein
MMQRKRRGLVGQGRWIWRLEGSGVRFFLRRTGSKKTSRLDTGPFYPLQVNQCLFPSEYSQTWVHTAAQFHLHLQRGTFCRQICHSYTICEGHIDGARTGPSCRTNRKATLQRSVESWGLAVCCFYSFFGHGHSQRKNQGPFVASCLRVIKSPGSSALQTLTVSRKDTKAQRGEASSSLLIFVSMML